MKKLLLLILIVFFELLLLIGVLLGISLSRSHSAPLPFEIGQDLRQNFSSDINEMAGENYWLFVNQRFILVKDDEGILQWVKIDNEYGRNNYQFENALIEDEYFKYYTENGEVTSSVGIDVSKYQGSIDWAQGKEAGVDFAFVRVGFRGYGNGKLVLDDTFDYNVAEALKNDLNVGVYFFSQATTYEEGVEEAQFVLNHVKAYNINLPIVIDTEDAMDDTARTADLTPQERTAACLGFMDTIRNAGYPTMLYANLRWIALDLDITQLHGYDIWFAQYADEPTLPYEYKIWQYTPNGSIPGISQPVDLNIGFSFYGKD